MSKSEHTGELHAGISDIRLYTDLQGIHLEVKTAGIWYEVMYLPKDQKFDYRVSASEIRRLYLEKKAIKDFTQSSEEKDGNH